MWTKRELIMAAFGEIGLASYDFDLQPEEMQSAVLRLDSMLATWEAKGVRVGYRFPATPDDSDPDDDSGLPDMANETAFLNLAIRLAPGYGKQVSPDSRKAAREGYDTLLRSAATPSQQQFKGTLPAGAGNRHSRTFLRAPIDTPLLIAPGETPLIPE